MNLAHKFSKLFSLDLLESARERFHRLAHPVDAGAILATLDAAAWADLQRRYQPPTHSSSEDSRNSYKFADARYWIKVNVERAQDLALDSTPRRRILDLGCGAGYFLYVCQFLGHEVLGFDLDENPLYRETIRLLGLNRVSGRIEPHEPLPDLGGRFDLVTAHCLCFQKIRSDATPGWVEWGADEWSFFLRDVRSRLLLPGGTLLLDFNPRDRGRFYPPEVKSLFLAEGAKISRSKVLLPALSPVPVAV